ncbi:MAG: SH3 domain-containing protein, partial [Oscillospiraceae bacterium]|nr:SH3 domain-containing protein [Oscillospiraceae bacterium]
MPDGAEIQVIESDGSWALVTYNGVNGYCSMDYLTAVSESTDVSGETTTEAATTTAVTTTTESLSDEFAGNYIVSAGGSYLNMRSGTSTSTSIIARIPDGTEVTVTAANDDWAAVTWDGNTGYCSMGYLIKPEETTTSEAASETTTTPTTTTAADATTTAAVTTEASA